MRKSRDLLVIGGLTAVLSLTTLTGCSWSRSKEAKESGRTENQVTADKDTTSRVEGELKTSSVYKFPSVMVQTYNGTVELSGFVNTEEQKRAAGDIAQKTPGVKQVNNQITVAPQTAPTGRQEPTAPQVTGHQTPEPNQDQAPQQK